MPLFIFAMLLKAVVECARACVRKPREAKPAPLCADCVFAHVQYGANGRRAISCTYRRWSTSDEAGCAVLHGLSCSKCAIASRCDRLCVRDCIDRVRGWGQALFSAVAKEHSDMPEGLPHLFGSG
jgi:hypothetical protein